MLTKDRKRFEEQPVEPPWWETELVMTTLPWALHGSWLKLTRTMTWVSDTAEVLYAFFQNQLAYADFRTHTRIVHTRLFSDSDLWIWKGASQSLASIPAVLESLVFRPNSQPELRAEIRSTIQKSMLKSGNQWRNHVISKSSTPCQRPRHEEHIRMQCCRGRGWILVLSTCSYVH